MIYIAAVSELPVDAVRRNLLRREAIASSAKSSEMRDVLISSCATVPSADSDRIDRIAQKDSQSSVANPLTVKLEPLCDFAMSGATVGSPT